MRRLSVMVNGFENKCYAGGFLAGAFILIAGLAVWSIGIIGGDVINGTVCFAGVMYQDGVKVADTDKVEDKDVPDVKAISDSLELIRGLKFKHAVPAENQSIEDFEAYITSELDSVFPKGKGDDIQAGLLRLGMLLEPIDLAGEFKNALLSQAGAYYDPVKKKFFYLMADLPKEMLDGVAAHELTHALQDQHFDLGKLMSGIEDLPESEPRADDAILAMRMLVEGEATYVMMLWQMKAMMGMDLHDQPEVEKTTFKMLSSMDMSQIVAMAQAQFGVLGDDGEENDIMKAMSAMDEIPSYILNPMYAAYMQGAYFVLLLRDTEGGWGQVDKAYGDLPVSAEQTLHPVKKYLSERDNPTILKLAGLDKRLKVNGWELIDSAIHGEFYLNLLLRNYELDKAVADTATSGWDGDIYRAYKTRDGSKIMVVMATTWDSEKDAKQFYDAYKAILPVKYASVSKAESDDETDTDYLYSCSADDKSGDTGRLVLRGKEVFLVEGCDNKTATSLVEYMKKMKIEYVK